MSKNGWHGRCKLNRHKTVNDFWKKVIYSDECKVELGMDNRVLIWRRPGEEWTPPCLNPGRGCRVSLMIWVYINYEGVGTLTVVDGNINAKQYIEVIDNLVWPVIARHSQMIIMCSKMIMSPYIGHR